MSIRECKFKPLFRLHHLLWMMLLVLVAIIPGNTFAKIPLHRKVLVLFDGKSGQKENMNLIYQDGQTILNYLGLLTDYRDINHRPLPNDSVMSDYRGIITIFTGDIKTGSEEYLKWLIRQIQAQRKIIIIGKLGATAKPKQDPKLNHLIHRTYRHLGFENLGHFTITQPNLRYVFKNKRGVEFESPYPPFPCTYEKIVPTVESINVYLTIERKDLPESTSSVIFTSPIGGFAHQDYVLWKDPLTFRRKWYLNPFRFFKEALSLEHMPIPDPTTLNGMRVAFSHIDGDGFSGQSRIEKKTLCAEIIRDHVLKKYDFPVTASVIVGEIDPQAAGNSELVKLAKEIFRLPNVEPASHSYSHPFYWDPNFKDKYDSQYGIHIPGYSYTRKMEIDYSMKYITENLSPPDKPCRVFLWSGNCVPMEKDVARTDALGYLNMNGGDTMFDDFNNSYTSVAPYYRKVGNRFQIYTGQANENILTNLWKGPYYGYRNIITTMKRTGSPRRVAPIDIYYHFYSGEYPASLKSLQDVYDWVLGQEIAPVYTSQYIEMVQGYLAVKIFRDAPGRYTIRNYGKCLTMRLDTKNQRPDLTRSVNVLGFFSGPQGLYVSLAPGKNEATLVLSDTTVSSKNETPQPHLRKASAWVAHFDATERLIRIDYEGHGEGKIEVAGLMPDGPYELSGNARNGFPVMQKSDEKGTLSIGVVQSGTIKISWQQHRK